MELVEPVSEVFEKQTTQDLVERFAKVVDAAFRRGENLSSPEVLEISIRVDKLVASCLELENI